MFSKYLSFTVICTSLFIHSGISLSYAGPFSGFTVLNAPGALNTFVLDINNFGQILGSYNELSNPENGNNFIYDKGNYQIITIAKPTGVVAAAPIGFNDVGQMVGTSTFSDHTGHGFLYDNGVFTTIDHPNTFQQPGLPPGIGISDINNLGQVVGSYIDNNLLDHGFIYKNGQLTDFKVPKVKSALPSRINDRGVIVGSYRNKNNKFFGFVYKNKKFTSIKHPKEFIGTTATGINNRGLIVGFYNGRGAKSHGFVYTKKGKFIDIKVPGIASGLIPNSINDNNQIVGYFLDGVIQHGFLVTYTPKP